MKIRIPWVSQGSISVEGTQYEVKDGFADMAPEHVPHLGGTGATVSNPDGESPIPTMEVLSAMPTLSQISCPSCGATLASDGTLIAVGGGPALVEAAADEAPAEAPADTPEEPVAATSGRGRS